LIIIVLNYKELHVSSCNISWIPQNSTSSVLPTYSYIHAQSMLTSLIKLSDGQVHFLLQVYKITEAF